MDEVRRVIKELRRGRYGARNMALVRFGLGSGARVSEALSLRWRDVMEEGIIYDVIQIQKRHTKGKRRSRDMDVSPKLKKVLKKWLAVYTAQFGAPSKLDFVFRSQVDDHEGRSKPITRQHAWDVLKKACRRAGVVGQTGTHSLRKTFAQVLLDGSGGNMELTSYLLGHSDVGVTRRYTNVDRKVGSKIIKERGL